MRDLYDPFELMPLLKEHEVKSLSYSKISNADKCLTALEYSLDRRLPYITDEARAKGTSYHAGLDVYYRARMASQPSDDELDPAWWPQSLEAAEEALKAESESFGFVWETDFERAFGTVQHMLGTYFEDNCYWPEGYVVVASETEFILPLSEGWVARGILDRAFTDGHTLYLVDDKSAKKPWKRGKESHRNTPQPAWYVRWGREIWPGFQDYQFVFDVMTLDGQFERRPAQVSEHHVAGCMEKASRLTALIDAGGPFPPNVGSFLCSAKWCDWWEICPFGEAFDSGVSVSIEQFVAKAGAS